ncbi:MAG: hypothetical protein ACC628_11285 [Pirellulaceae bacterium]
MNAPFQRVALAAIKPEVSGLEIEGVVASQQFQLQAGDVVFGHDADAAALLCGEDRGVGGRTAEQRLAVRSGQTPVIGRRRLVQRNRVPDHQADRFVRSITDRVAHPHARSVQRDGALDAVRGRLSRDHDAARLRALHPRLPAGLAVHLFGTQRVESHFLRGWKGEGRSEKVVFLRHGQLHASGWCDSELKTFAHQCRPGANRPVRLHVLAPQLFGHARRKVADGQVIDDHCRVLLAAGRIPFHVGVDEGEHVGPFAFDAVVRAPADAMGQVGDVEQIPVALFTLVGDALVEYVAAGAEERIQHGHAGRRPPPRLGPQCRFEEVLTLEQPDMPVPRVALQRLAVEDNPEIRIPAGGLRRVEASKRMHSRPSRRSGKLGSFSSALAGSAWVASTISVGAWYIGSRGKSRIRGSGSACAPLMTEATMSTLLGMMFGMMEKLLFRDTPVTYCGSGWNWANL